MGYAHRLEGGRQVQLQEFDPAEDAGLTRKAAAHQTAQLLRQVLELQELLYAVRQQSVLIILQGRDTSGKDGTIRQVAGQLNAQSCTVTAFQAPTAAERAHDFLWRVHAQTPPAGYIKIFNRSHLTEGCAQFIM
jgi:polyphosphate kinase 2 (PPK2 family)